MKTTGCILLALLVAASATMAWGQAAPLQITTNSPLPDGTVNLFYGPVQFTATGGTPPYAWSGTPPTGLTLGADGVLSGTPTSPGAFTFGVQVRDGAGVVASGSFAIAISSNLFLFPDGYPPRATVNTPYSYALTVEGGVAPYTWELLVGGEGSGGTLPAGLDLSSDGIISGVPTETGWFWLEVLVTESAPPGQTPMSAWGWFSLEIARPPLTLSPSAATIGCCGEALTLTITGSNLFTSDDGELIPGDVIWDLDMFSESGDWLEVVDWTTDPETLTVIAPTSYFELALSRRSQGDMGPATLPIEVPIGVETFDGTAYGAAYGTFTINDVPTITTQPPLPDGVAGAPYSFTFETAGGTTPFTWSWSGTPPPGLAIDPATGLISGIPTTPGNFTFQVQLTDASDVSASAEFTLLVNPPPAPVITTASPLPAGAVGLPYSPVNFTGELGMPPYIWSGTPPPGLTLSSGVLSGAPTVPGIFTFPVQLTDALSVSAIGSFSITISSNLAIPPALLPQATYNTAYSAVLSATGGLPPYAWSLASGALPAGLVLGSGGAISGTPTQSGAFSFIARVTETAPSGLPAATAERAFSLSVSGGAVEITAPSALPDATGGKYYGQYIYAAGGAPPYTWSVSDSKLPSGMVLDARTGYVSGTPSEPGRFDFTVTVTDGWGESASWQYSLLVKPALAIVTLSLPDARRTVPYSQTLAATAGVSPYAWSVTGQLPPGLALNAATGEISGEPSSAGTFRFTAIVTDAEKTSATRALSVVVGEQPETLRVATAALQNATVAEPYALALEAVGGAAPYTWSASGSLPPGLSLDVSGTLAGTPTQAGTFPFTVRVTCAEQQTATAQLSLTVVPPPLTIAPDSLPAGIAGSPYEQALAAGGGTPPYRWSVSGAPAGLSIAAETGALGGTPAAAGTFTLAVQVTDAADATITRSYTLDIRAPDLPPVDFKGLPPDSGPAQQLNFGVVLDSGYPLPIEGRLALSFAPDAAPGDDPAIQFATGGRAADFLIQPGGIEFPDIGVQTGTVAGTITITLDRLQAGNTDLTPSPKPTRTIRINRLAPAITSLRVTRTTSGFEVHLTGHSTPREVTQATFRFTAGSGATLQTSEFTVPVGSVFTTWYGSAASGAFGSMFEYTQPFSVQGNAAGITSVTVTLTNSVGTSPPATASF